MSAGFQISIPPELFAELVDQAAELALERLAEREAGSAWPAFMSLETASRYTDQSVERLRKLVARRALPCHREAPGCRVFLARVDLDRWMASTRHPARGGDA